MGNLRVSAHAEHHTASPRVGGPPSGYPLARPRSKLHPPAGPCGPLDPERQCLSTPRPSIPARGSTRTATVLPAIPHQARARPLRVLPSPHWRAALRRQPEPVLLPVAEGAPRVLEERHNRSPPHHHRGSIHVSQIKSPHKPCPLTYAQTHNPHAQANAPRTYVLHTRTKAAPKSDHQTVTAVAELAWRVGGGGKCKLEGAPKQQGLVRANSTFKGRVKAMPLDTRMPRGIPKIESLSETPPREYSSLGSLVGRLAKSLSRPFSINVPFSFDTSWAGKYTFTSLSRSETALSLSQLGLRSRYGTPSLHLEGLVRGPCVRTPSRARR